MLDEIRKLLYLVELFIKGITPALRKIMSGGKGRGQSRWGLLLKKRQGVDLKGRVSGLS